MDGSPPLPPLPKDIPCEPPLPPSEPLPHLRPSKRLGIGDGDGDINNSSEPPMKKLRRHGRTSDSHGGKGVKRGSRQPTAAELQALEDGELEDSDDSGVKDTYLVIEKKGRNTKKPMDTTEEMGVNIVQSHKAVTNGPEVGGNKGNSSGAGPSVSLFVKNNENSTDGKNTDVAVVLKEEKSKKEGQVKVKGPNNEQGEGSAAVGEEDEDDNEEEMDTNQGEATLNDDFESAILAQEFAVIDDLEQSENEENEDEEDYDSDLIDEEEVEALLDEDFLKRKELEKAAGKDTDYTILEKTVIVEHGNDPFDILPEGWLQVPHNSGMTLYLHKKSRVCTLAKPYFLGSGSARRHDIPLSAIPCLQYKKALQDEKNTAKADQKKKTKESEKENQPVETQPPIEEIMDDQTVKLTQSTAPTCPMAAQGEKVGGPTERNDLPQSAGSEDKAKCEVDQSTAMILKLQEDLNQLAALAQGSPSTTSSSTPSPGAPPGCVSEGKVQEESSQPQDTNEDQTVPTAMDEGDVGSVKQTTMGQGDVGSVKQTTLDETVVESVKQETDEKQKDETETPLTEETATQAAGKEQNVTNTNQKQKKGKQSDKTAKDVKIASVKEHKEKNYLKPHQIQEYCNRLFEFKKVYYKRFRSWKTRRAWTRQKCTQKPTLPEGTKLLMCPIPLNSRQLAEGTTRKREFMLNPKGKSDVSILHEYAQLALRVQPQYLYEVTANAMKPHSATITIQDIKYGTASAASKKAAKATAAYETLKILIPDFVNLRENAKKRIDQTEFSFFDEIKIEDARVTELSVKTGQPLPFEILQECLKRNYGLGDTSVTMDMKIIKPKLSEFTMKVSKYEAKVTCKSKRDGKQRAAQSILQQLHPYVTSWGSLLRLYASIADYQDKPEKSSITSLQCKVALEPNHAILNKLKEEMHKLKNRRQEVEANIKGRIEMPAIELKSSQLGHVDLQ